MCSKNISQISKGRSLFVGGAESQRRRNKEKGGVCGKKIQKTRLSWSISFFFGLFGGGSPNFFLKNPFAPHLRARHKYNNFSTSTKK
jgi:hypothetical protein